MLREINEGVHCKLIRKILHCRETANQEWMIFVWDGTDLRPNSISSKLEDELRNPLTLHPELVPLSKELLCTFPAVGSILRIAYDKSIDKNPYKPFRKCLYKERTSLNLRKMPFWSFPWPSYTIVTDHDYAPVSTLMNVLPYSQVTAKFKCVVRVVAAMPWSAENFHSASGIYRMRLTLEDPTARIHAYVYAEDGEFFFDGYPSNSILTQKMNSLFGVTPCDDDGIVPNCALRTPPSHGFRCASSLTTLLHLISGEVDDIECSTPK